MRKEGRKRKVGLYTILKGRFKQKLGNMRKGKNKRKTIKERKESKKECVFWRDNLKFWIQICTQIKAKGKGRGKREKKKKTLYNCEYWDMENSFVSIYSDNDMND